MSRPRQQTPPRRQLPKIQPPKTFRVPDEDADEAAIMFQRCDADRNGKISTSEVEVLIEQLGFEHATKDYLQGIIDAYDVDQSGFLEINEFKKLYSIVKSKRIAEDKHAAVRENLKNEQVQIIIGAVFFLIVFILGILLLFIAPGVCLESTTSMSQGAGRRLLTADAAEVPASFTAAFTPAAAASAVTQRPGRQLRAGTCPTDGIPFVDMTGATCPTGKYEFNQCPDDGCEASTACPTVTGGTCTACTCSRNSFWQLDDNWKYTGNIATDYIRATESNGLTPASKIHLLNSECAGHGVTSIEFTGGGNTAVTKCDAASVTKGSNGITSINIPSSRVDSGTCSSCYSKPCPKCMSHASRTQCHSSNSCVSHVLTTEVIAAKAGEIAEFTFNSVEGSDWYEATVVLYKAATPGVKNLNTDTVAAVDGIRGDEIGTGAKCPTSFDHDVCGGATAKYTCDADGYITDVLTVPSDGNYYLAFYAGSYDHTGARMLGATMRIKTFRLLPATCAISCDKTQVAPAATCTAVSCTPPFKDTNGDPSDGCEDGPTPSPTSTPSPTANPSSATPTTPPPTSVSPTAAPTTGAPTVPRTNAPTQPCPVQLATLRSAEAATCVTTMNTAITQAIEVAGEGSCWVPMLLWLLALLSAIPMVLCMLAGAKPLVFELPPDTSEPVGKASAKGHGGQAHIIVADQHNDGRTSIVKVPPQMTSSVAELKNKVAQATGCKPGDQDLRHAGTQLTGGAISDFGLNTIDLYRTMDVDVVGPDGKKCRAKIQTSSNMSVGELLVQAAALAGCDDEPCELVALTGDGANSKREKVPLTDPAKTLASYKLNSPLTVQVQISNRVAKMRGSTPTRETRTKSMQASNVKGMANMYSAGFVPGKSLSHLQTNEVSVSKSETVVVPYGASAQP